jgi:hypothetical protein
MNTIICENCNTEFRKVFSFDGNGEGVHYFECPNCGAHTRPREIDFTEEGNVILAKNKEGKPILAYQVANPNDEKTYGNVISIKQENSGDDKKQQRAKKPFNKNSKQNGKDKKPNNKKSRKPFRNKGKKERKDE